jgi:hypothetical protein
VHGHPWRRWATATLIVATGALAAGCDADEPDPAPTASAPVSQARYTGLTGPCPTLTSAEAKRYGASGVGTPGGASPAATLPGLTEINCAWAARDVRPSVRVSVQIYPDGFAPTGTGAGNAAKYYADLRSDAEQDAADPSAHLKLADEAPGFVAAYAGTGSVTRSVLLDNAVVTTIIGVPDATVDDLDARAAELLREVGPDAVAVTTEVTGQLR